MNANGFFVCSAHVNFQHFGVPFFLEGKAKTRRRGHTRQQEFSTTP